jgi:formyl-CoA transferase
VAHREELNELIRAKLLPLETKRAAELLDAAGVANASINQVEDFLNHPVLEGRDRWRPVQVPGGEIEALRPPADLAGVEPVMGPVPALGEHTTSILRELGRSEDVISDLRDRDLV